MSFLQDITNRMSTILCCSAPVLDEPQPARLKDLLPASVGSISPPRMQTGTSNDILTNDAEVLHDIFSSLSSFRGYHAAGASSATRTAISNSFDGNFYFPCQSPEKKQTGRLEQIGHHIKQRLSESRLSKSSSKTTVKDCGNMSKPPTSTPMAKQDEQPSLLGASHRSTGLSDLLLSRAGSERGYDSDAKSIKIPSMKSKTGPLVISSSSIKQTLDMHGPGSEMLTASALETAKENTIAASLSNGRRKARSSSLPSTPSPVSFSEAIQFGNNESPGDVLRRFSAGITKGNIKLPETPELKAMRMPSVDKYHLNWRLSLPALRRASSLSKADNEACKIVKGLNNGSIKTEKHSLEIAGDRICQRLVSNHEPALLDHVHGFEDENMPSPGDEEDISGSNRNSDVDVARVKAQHDSSMESLPTAQSDNDSIHLQNMRISQRLASTSQIPMLSPSNSDFDSEAGNRSSCTGAHAVRSLSSTAHFPSLIAQEHNRRPSDPETRRLFENGANQAEGYPKWKTVTSCDISGFAGNPDFNHVSREDASSFYLSDCELPGSDQASSASHSRRKSTINPNSIAMPRRSTSRTIPVDYGSMRSISNAGEGAWFGKNPAWQSQNGKVILSSIDGMNANAGTRNRSVSMLKETRFNKVMETPTPKSKRAYSLTERNKVSSQASLQEFVCIQVNKWNNVSTKDPDDRRNETMSDIGPRLFQGPNLADGKAVEQRGSAGWLSQGYRSGWNFDPVRIEGSRPQSPSREHQHESGKIHESATNMWERALSRAREEGTTSSDSNILSLPKFDRAGKRRLSGTSASDQDQSRGRKVLSDVRGLRSDYDGGSFSLEWQQRLCSDAKEPLSGSKSEGLSEMRKRDENPTQGKPKKRSLLDIRRFTSIGAPTGSYRVSTEPPSKDVLTWAKFPSHTRDHRCGTATKEDGVEGTDFQPENSEQESYVECLMYNSNLSTSNFGRRTPGSWRLLALKNRSTKSCNLLFKERQSQGAKITKNGKGLFRNWKGPYHSHSADLRRYVTGHISNGSAGRDLQYPELEDIPDDGLRRRTTHIGYPSLNEIDISPKAKKRSASCSGMDAEHARESADWLYVYRGSRGAEKVRRRSSSRETNTPPQECFSTAKESDGSLKISQPRVEKPANNYVNHVDEMTKDGSPNGELMPETTRPETGEDQEDELDMEPISERSDGHELASGELKNGKQDLRNELMRNSSDVGRELMDRASI